MYWRVLFDLFSQFRQRQIEREQELRKVSDRVNEQVYSKICQAASNIEKASRTKVDFTMHRCAPRELERIAQ
jgi:hypothetical protein